MPRGIPKSGKRNTYRSAATIAKVEAKPKPQLSPEATTHAALNGTQLPRSIFHIEANTAEELRVELVQHLTYQMSREQSRSTGAKTLRESAQYAARISLLKNLADFWSTINIDKH